jgi:hypothetical protein
MAGIKDCSLELYWELVSDKVCSKCIDGDGSGNCRLDSVHRCELREQFPKIVETVLSVKSDRMEPYVEALRKNVCAGCSGQSADGTCKIRNELDCGLDRYFELIVEVIEGVSPSST